MRAIIKFILLLCILSVNDVCGQSHESVAVIELFTSEGCSSCPAADELLKEMVLNRENEGNPLIALSFHITYWNHLGWIDPYSHELYTNRQKKYAAIFKNNQIYTPQAIANGTLEFVGSNRDAFRDSLKKAERKPVYTIEAKAMQRKDSIEIHYKLNKDPKNQVLNIAIVEKNIERTITRGENKSRMLMHFNVVRGFNTIEPGKQGTFVVHTIENLATDNAEIVLYLQHKKTWRILGASRISAK